MEGGSEWSGLGHVLNINVTVLDDRINVWCKKQTISLSFLSSYRQVKLAQSSQW